jgi:hypothetical protein
VQKMVSVVAQLIEHLTTHHKNEGLIPFTIFGTLRMSGKILFGRKQLS